MIDIAGWLEFVKLAPGYALALIAFIWKRADDAEHKTAFQELAAKAIATEKENNDAYRLLLERVLTATQETNKALDSIASASKISERLGAIEDALDGKSTRRRT